MVMSDADEDSLAELVLDDGLHCRRSTGWSASHRPRTTAYAPTRCPRGSSTARRRLGPVGLRRHRPTAPGSCSVADNDVATAARSPEAGRCGSPRRPADPGWGGTRLRLRPHRSAGRRRAPAAATGVRQGADATPSRAGSRPDADQPVGPAAPQGQPHRGPARLTYDGPAPGDPGPDAAAAPARVPGGDRHHRAHWPATGWTERPQGRAATVRWSFRTRWGARSYDRSKSEDPAHTGAPCAPVAPGRRTELAAALEAVPASRWSW